MDGNFYRCFCHRPSWMMFLPDRHVGMMVTAESPTNRHRSWAVDCHHEPFSFLYVTLSCDWIMRIYLRCSWQLLQQLVMQGRMKPCSGRSFQEHCPQLVILSCGRHAPRQQRWQQPDNHNHKSKTRKNNAYYLHIISSSSWWTKCILPQWSADVGMGRQTPPSSFFLSKGWHGSTSALLPPQAAYHPFHTSQSSACGGHLTQAPWPRELLGLSRSLLPVTDAAWQETELLVWFLAIWRTPARITLLSGICVASHEDPGAELLL